MDPPRSLKMTAHSGWKYSWDIGINWELTGKMNRTKMLPWCLLSGSYWVTGVRPSPTITPLASLHQSLPQQPGALSQWPAGFWSASTPCAHDHLAFWASHLFIVARTVVRWQAFKRYEGGQVLGHNGLSHHLQPWHLISECNSRTGCSTSGSASW